jgi:hypothetical protein
MYRTTSSLDFHQNFTNGVDTSSISEVSAPVIDRIELKPVTTKSPPHLRTKWPTDQIFLNLPKPGSMEFSDAQKAHWEKHTQPKVSKKINKLTLLRNIAHDQEKAGLHFTGRRSLAEAEANLIKEQLVQTSQATRAQNFLSLIGNSIKDLAYGIDYFFQPTSSIMQLNSELSRTIGDKKFIVRKSEALSKREAAGEGVTAFGIGIVDHNHGSIEVQSGISIFLAEHFRPERGDIFLAEAVAVFEEDNGKDKIGRPSIEKHHTYFCRGIPIQFCRFLREPEKETADLLAVIAERRDLVNRVFEFLMNAIPPAKASEAREKLNTRNNAVATADTDFKVGLIIDYQDYCDLAKIKRLERRVDPITAALQKEKAAQMVALSSRDAAYFDQITDALKELKPGARLYYTMGKAHFRRLDAKLDQTDGFFIDIVNPDQKDEF